MDLSQISDEELTAENDKRIKERTAITMQRYVEEWRTKMTEARDETKAKVRKIIDVTDHEYDDIEQIFSDFFNGGDEW